MLVSDEEVRANCAVFPDDMREHGHVIEALFMDWGGYPDRGHLWAHLADDHGSNTAILTMAEDDQLREAHLGLHGHHRLP